MLDQHAIAARGRATQGDLQIAGRRIDLERARAQVAPADCSGLERRTDLFKVDLAGRRRS